ncbi:PREDICTED: bromodomain-containing protein DDB_G0280777-like [Rhagoletis zephyria]|uniref:bromodomain-containing protein DDB_G0280777-like n=1 Tax=Rhagoletis zephyria TaxID=28612 RepID=UPI00081120B7|nr:PREDICTED: bromodomain-containing protein DDB_G0280777-like [Rhagoletis zephyria]
MKMQEALLKSRWHFLCEHYKRNAITDSQVAPNQFPYKKEMEFLLPYLRPPQREERPSEESLPMNVIKPEFVITEKDLENDSGSEEYVFLEVETLGSEDETNNEATHQLNDNELRNELQEEGQERMREQEQEHEQDQQQQDNEVNEIERIEVEVHIKQEEPENLQQYNEILRESRHLKKEIQEVQCNRSGATEEEAVRTQIHEATEEKVEGKVEIREGDSSSDNTAGSVSTNNTTNRSNNPEERCEDAIFGELVSAMLKKMPAEKKRAVKRDIMNLLLT